MERIEVKFHNSENETEKREIFGDLDSIEEVEEAIRFKERSKRRKGGRKNKVKHFFQNIKDWMEKNEQEEEDKSAFQGAKKYLDAKDELSRTSFWRLRKKLQQEEIQIEDCFIEDAKRIRANLSIAEANERQMELEE